MSCDNMLVASYAAAPSRELLEDRMARGFGWTWRVAFTRSRPARMAEGSGLLPCGEVLFVYVAENEDGRVNLTVLSIDLPKNAFLEVNCRQRAVPYGGTPFGTAG